MHDRVAELCRRLAPLVPLQTRRLWSAYRAEPDPAARSRIEHTLEMLASKHLSLGFEHDRSPFPPPNKAWAEREGLPVGEVVYADKRYCGFNLELDRLTEHVLVCGRSGSGKSTLTTCMARGLMSRGVIVTAFDWKRSYRDLLHDVPTGQLRVRTPGRDLAPLYWNPLIPPPGTDPVLYAKLIVDVICRALLGGDGVISLLHRGILALYQRVGVGTDQQERWPTIQDLLEWLESTKLTGRAAMWKSSADRILRAMTYGGFGQMIDTQTNTDLLALLDTHHVLELDGLAGSADRSIFAEGVTLWLYRYLLHRGERRHIERVWIHEESHFLLGQGDGASGGNEGVLEQSLRMARAYGVGYIIVDQQASLLSKTVFSNTGTVFALNQKLRSDIQAIAGAMNLDEAQKQAVSTLPVGTTIARVPDGHPEPFLVRIPAPTDRTHITDEQIRRQAIASTQSTDRRSIEDDIVAMMQSERDKAEGDSGSSGRNETRSTLTPAITALPASENRHPATPEPSFSPEPVDEVLERQFDPDDPSDELNQNTQDKLQRNTTSSNQPSSTRPPRKEEDSKLIIDKDLRRFLADLARHPLSTTVQRYEWLGLSRRKGHAMRSRLVDTDYARPVRIATRSGNVVLLELTRRGRQALASEGIETVSAGSGGVEHRYWTDRVDRTLRNEGYSVKREVQVDDNGRIDLVATNESGRIAIEIETGRSDITHNLTKAIERFDETVCVATNAESIDRCNQAIQGLSVDQKRRVKLKTWLDF